VGTAESIALSGSAVPDRAVRVVLKIQSSLLAAITSDSTADLTADNLVGDKFVDIASGVSPKHVAPGGEIRYKSTELMQSLDLAQFEQQLRIVDATLADMEAGRGSLGQFVQKDNIYTSLIQQLTALEQKIRRAARTTGSVGDVLYTDRMYRLIDDPLVKLDRTLARIQSSPWMRDTAQYEQFLDAARKLRKSVADIRAGQLFQSGDLYADWNRRVIAFARGVDDFNANPAFTNSLVYDNLTGAFREMTVTVRDFREHPGKYLMQLF